CAFPRAAMTHQADHLARRDIKVDAVDDRAVAVSETDIAQLDPALYGSQPYRLRKLGHIGYLVQDVENALGARSGLLGERYDAAHAVQPDIEPADIRQKGG